jgi:flagellar basal body P-ring formation protein FlgA
MIRLTLALLALASPLKADILVATRTIPAQSLIGPDDIETRAMDVPGAVTDPSQIVGMEARIALYAGRPIRPGDVGFPAVVERNAIVALVYDTGGLVITTEGRALDRAGPGDVIRVMNIASRTTVSATIGIDGAAYVSQ